ncbi:MAG: acyl-CoA dehydrogenase family protein [Acidobacteria bacterium]|nr:acyl-CoA dehydrogenase family protein [Acidobacteriota bacterium]
MTDARDQAVDEDVESFRIRARAWIEANLPDRDHPGDDDRALQALLFDSGFAGIAFPREYGGAGLTLAHQKVFYDEVRAAHRWAPCGMPWQVSIGMMAPTILDHGSEELKRRHLPRMLRGEETWMQLLSEPRGGSDLAGATTRLTRDGDTYVLNGAKMWSSGAHTCDFGLCLARTDWDAPKHRGLSMIAVPLHDTPGLVLEVIRAVDGNPGHFCQEFFDDVVVPVENLVGEENSGWAVAQSLLFHERNATGGAGYGYGLQNARPTNRQAQRSADGVIATAKQRGVGGDPVLRQLMAESYIEYTASRFANDRIAAGMRTGQFKGPWGSLLKLHLGALSSRHAKIGLAVGGADGVIWEGDAKVGGVAGEAWLSARGIAIAGGTNEIQRNIVSERLLGLPREPSPDRDLPFSEVVRNQHR